MAKTSKAHKQVIADEAQAQVREDKLNEQKPAGYYVNLGGGQQKFVPTGGTVKPKE